MSDHLRDKSKSTAPDLSVDDPLEADAQPQVDEQPQVELVASPDKSDDVPIAKSVKPDSGPEAKRKALRIVAVLVSLFIASLIGVNQWIGPGIERPQIAYFYWDKDRTALPTLLLQCQLREIRAGLAHNLGERHAELVNMANIYLLQGDMVNAERVLMQAANVEANSHYNGQPNAGPSGRRYCAFDLLTQIYADRGEWNKAAETLDRSLQVDQFTLLAEDVPRQLLAAQIYTKVGRNSDAERARRVADRASRRIFDRGDFEPIFPVQAPANAQIQIGEQRSFNEIFPAACSMLEVGDASAARHYFQFMIDRKVPRPADRFILREPDDAYDYTLLSQMLLPVTSVMLDDYASAKIQFPAAFAAMKRLAEIGIDTSEERELLFHHYARYLWQTGNPQEAKKYEEQARALKLRQEVEELKPWWKKSR